MTTFVEARNRYIIRCNLKSDGAVHIGSGIADALSDSPFIRQGDIAFIPGSTLRGVLRSAVERIARSLGPNAASRFCTLFEENQNSCQAGAEERRKAFEKLTADQQTAMLRRDGSLCPICRLFGSPLMQARLKITDALQTAATPAKPELRHGVGIDRDSGTAAPGIKYDFEVLEPACDFTFEMHLENADEDDFALLFIAIRELEHGIAIGGKKSRGMGVVRLAGEYTVECFDGAEQLRAYLLTGKPQTMTKAIFEGRLHAAFQTLCEREGF